MPTKSLKITVKDKSTKLPIKGQGVILFNRTSTTNAKFAFFSSGRTNKLSVEFSESGIHVSTNNGPLID